MKEDYLFGTLPSFVVHIIFHSLDLPDVVRLLCVSKFTKKWICGDNEIWKERIKERWPEHTIPTVCESFYKLFLEKGKEETVRLSFTPGRFITSVLGNCYCTYNTYASSKLGNPEFSSWWWVYRLREVFGLTGNSKMDGKEKEKEKEKESENIERGGMEEINETNYLIKHKIENGSRSSGWLRFLTISDVLRKFPHCTFLRTPSMCPYMDKTVGYINFDFEDLQNFLCVEARLAQDYIHYMLKYTHGLLGRVDKDHARHVREEYLSGYEMFAKYGIYDGDRFICKSKDSVYMQGILQSTQETLDDHFCEKEEFWQEDEEIEEEEEEGKEEEREEKEEEKPEVFFMGTAHNNVRVNASAKQMEEIHRITFSLWLSDWCDDDLEPDLKMWGE